MARVARLTELGARPALQVATVEGREVLLVGTENDEIFAIDSLCTHGRGYLDQGVLRGYELQCPLHAGCFDVRTGEALRLPAREPVRSYSVAVVDDEIYVDLAVANE